MFLQSKAALRPSVNTLSDYKRTKIGTRNVAAFASSTLTVVVTGAGGRTGALAVKKLLQQPEKFAVRAVVRGSKSKGKVIEMGVKESEVFEVDVAAGRAGDYAAAFASVDAVILATSGVPQLKPLSLIKVFWAKLTGQTGVGPDFDWKEGQFPEQVDWLGAKAQVDAAQAAGVKRVVVVGSMGGTQPDNMLNKLGNGNILLWKRKAEQYLIKSNLAYTIIHPGGLLDEPGGKRKLLLGVDDVLLKRKVRSIPREDVADLCVQSLLCEAAANRAFDAISIPVDSEEEGPAAIGDFPTLLASLNGANCDYTIQSQW